MTAYRSADELREILDSVMRDIDSDPEDGPRLRGAAAPLQIEFSDLGLVLNVAPDSAGKHCLLWDFSEGSGAAPKLKLTMDSDFANRFRRTPDHPVRRTSAWRRLAKQTVEAWVARHGWLCPGWHREPHRVRPGELAADHPEPLVLWA